MISCFRFVFEIFRCDTWKLYFSYTHACICSYVACSWKPDISICWVLWLSSHNLERRLRTWRCSIPSYGKNLCLNNRFKTLWATEWCWKMDIEYGINGCFLSKPTADAFIHTVCTYNQFWFLFLNIYFILKQKGGSWHCSPTEVVMLVACALFKHAYWNNPHSNMLGY